jgi:hypothetical protein
VRLGIAWFIVNVVALGFGLVAVVPLWAVTAAAAALQSARTWRLVGVPVQRHVAGAGAALLPLAAAVSAPALGMALLVVAVAAAYIAYTDTTTKRGTLAAIGDQLQCALLAGGAAAAVVLTYRYEIGAVVGLLLVVSAYETGDYLVGSGSSNAIEGPLAGGVAALVMSFAIGAIGIPPLGLPEAFGFGALAAVLCPVGQLAASAMLPTAASPAPALRRLDSLLLLAPAWAWLAGLAASG